MYLIPAPPLISTFRMILSYPSIALRVAILYPSSLPVLVSDRETRDPGVLGADGQMRQPPDFRLEFDSSSTRVQLATHICQMTSRANRT
jgi:hypothetical protein